VTIEEPLGSAEVLGVARIDELVPARGFRVIGSAEMLGEIPSRSASTAARNSALPAPTTPLVSAIHPSARPPNRGSLALRPLSGNRRRSTPSSISRSQAT